jgi:gliding motility-associated-like protein
MHIQGLFLSVCLLFAGSAGYTQTTVTLQPNASAGKDAGLFSCIPCGFNNQNYGQHLDLMGLAWTNGGAESLTRGLLQFDLCVLPIDAVITDARLSLYQNTTSGHGSHSSLSGPNKCLLERVTQPWDEQAVTWDNQPPSTSLHAVTLAPSSSANQNYLHIDVTQLVKDMVGQNYGFMLRLETESYYRKLVFASSDHANPALHPKLEITYTIGTAPVFPFLGADRTICPDEPVLLEATPDFLPVVWQDYSMASQFVATVPGIYWLDAMYCSVSVRDTIQLFLCSIDPIIYDIGFPTVFTPNEDGSNDMFVPLVLPDSLPPGHLVIFNRWGNVVFETSQPGVGWSGEFQGDACPDGVYFWKFEPVASSNLPPVMQGFVHLIR